jgi:hypothetical protein
MVKGKRSVAVRQEKREEAVEEGLLLTCPVQHFDALHGEAHGTVLLWEALNLGGQWKKLDPDDPKVPSLLKGCVGEKDTFLSVNEFDRWIQTHLLRSLRAFYVDIEGSVDLHILQEYLEVKGLPEPSLVVWSGRGKHLYWLLKPLPAKTLAVWQRLEDRLVGSLRLFGADPLAKDCTRVLRLVGSVNGKNGEEVRGQILTGKRWGLHEFADKVLGPRKEGKRGEVRDLHAQAAKRGQRVSKSLSGSIYERWYKVYQDLLKIANYHGKIPVGHRDEWLFLSAVALSWFTQADSLVYEIESNAKAFTSGLRSCEVEKISKLIGRKAEAAKSGEKVEWNGELVDPRYRFKRATLYERLEGLIPGELLPELRAILPDGLAKGRKRQRDHARFEDHYTGQGVRAANEDKRASARLMMRKGLSFREIAAELGVDVRTAYRWCDER